MGIKELRAHIKDSLGFKIIECIVVLSIMLGSSFGLISINLITPLFVLIGTLSLYIRGIGWKGIGLKRPANLTQNIFIGTMAGITYQFFSIYVEFPIIEALLDQEPDLSQFDDLRGNLPQLIVLWVLSWIWAGFGEEMADRGYLMNRINDWLGGKKMVLAVFITSIYFGISHSYQDLTGMVGAGLSGIFFAILYLKSGRNLTVPIVAHAVMDMLGIFFLYKGWFL